MKFDPARLRAVFADLIDARRAHRLELGADPLTPEAAGEAIARAFVGDHHLAAACALVGVVVAPTNAQVMTFAPEDAARHPSLRDHLAPNLAAAIGAVIEGGALLSDWALQAPAWSHIELVDDGDAGLRGFASAVFVGGEGPVTVVLCYGSEAPAVACTSTHRLSARSLYSLGRIVYGAGPRAGLGELPIPPLRPEADADAGPATVTRH